MSERPRPLKRFLLEGLVIVVSILLAFAVDAWWDRVQRQDDARDAVAGLLEDFEQNEGSIERIRLNLVQWGDAFHRFRDMTLEQVRRLQADPDSAAFYFTALWGASSFDSQDGTLEALISSGNLELVTDARLRAKLLRFKALEEDSQEEVLYMKNGGNAVTGRAAALGGPWALGDDLLPNWPQADLVAMKQDEVLMAEAANARYWCDVYLRELVVLKALTAEILADLEALR